MSLNPQSPLPLYRQLAERIESDISAGVYPVSSRIPSENVLASRYAIGRPTVRQATELLVREGQLERRRGSGTYVLAPSQSIDLFSLAGTSAALRDSDIGAELQVVSMPFAVPASALPTAALQLAGNECLKFERRAVVDGEIILFETFWFDAELFAGLEKFDFNGVSVSDLVKGQFHLQPESATQTFSAVAATALVSEQLGIDQGAPILRVLRQLHFAGKDSALTVEIICRTDQFEYSQTLFPSFVPG